MVEGLTEEERSQAVQFMTTEHFTLQTGRSGTIADANGRASLFIGTVSSALVALAFVGQASDLGTTFTVFGLVLLPPLFFLGLVTFERLVQSAIEDSIYARGINRIRHFYLDLVPAVRPYLIQSDHDDAAGAMSGVGYAPSSWQLVRTTAAAVGMVNSVIVGVGVGWGMDLLVEPSLAVAVGGGIGAFGLGVLGHARYQMTRWREFERQLASRFPTPPGDPGGEVLDGLIGR